MGQSPMWPRVEPGGEGGLRRAPVGQGFLSSFLDSESSFQDSKALECDPALWLRDSPQLDISHPKVRITAQKLTQALQSIPARVAAIQAFVRRLPFATSLDSRSIPASEVLRRRHGDCHSKGVLFVALCRAAEIPARLLFVEVRADFLCGILDEGPRVLPHAVGQAWVNECWISTDGYVVDPALFAQARQRLRNQNRDCGWGIVLEATGQWSGDCDCLQQFRAADVVRSHGVFHDARQFYATCAAQGDGGGRGLKYAVGAHLINRRVVRARRIDAP